MTSTKKESSEREVTTADVVASIRTSFAKYGKIIFGAEFQSMKNPVDAQKNADNTSSGGAHLTVLQERNSNSEPMTQFRMKTLETSSTPKLVGGCDASLQKLQMRTSSKPKRTPNLEPCSTIVKSGTMQCDLNLDESMSDSSFCSSSLSFGGSVCSDCTSHDNLSTIAFVGTRPLNSVKLEEPSQAESTCILQQKMEEILYAFNVTQKYLTDLMAKSDHIEIEKAERELEICKLRLELDAKNAALAELEKAIDNLNKSFDCVKNLNKTKCEQRNAVDAGTSTIKKEESEKAPKPTAREVINDRKRLGGPMTGLDESAILAQPRRKSTRRS